MTLPNMLETALAYAGRGWRILPLHTAVIGACSCGRDCGKDSSKHPRVKAWQKSATTDSGQITRWFHKWPDANIGVATGSGLVAIDVDSPEAFAQLEALARVHGPLPATLVAQTANGVHVYFAGDLAGSKWVGKLLFRGAGGYVVAPNSFHASGKRYQWIRSGPPGAELAPLPQCLIDLLQTADNTKVTAGDSALLSEFGPLPQHLINSRHDLTAKLKFALAEKWTVAEEARIRSALQAIPASCQREPWLRVGMALHNLDWQTPDSNRGFDLWNEWSAGCPDKYSLHDVETRWRSFGKPPYAEASGGKPRGVTVASLFHLAREHGWSPYAEASGDKADAGTNGAHALPQALTTAAVRQAAIHWPDQDDDGNPRSTCTNANVAIEALQLDCRKDLFHDKCYVGGHAIQAWAGDLTDDAVLMVRQAIKRQYGFDPGEKNTRDAAVQLCLANQYNPVTDYLDALAWDGVRRVPSWLHTYLGADDTTLNRAIGGLALIAAVRRARRPGTKFDQIIVLEGVEGKGKSSAIETLAGETNFSDQSILTLDDKGQQEALQGVWLYEIADLAGMHRADVEKVKAFASRRTDRARPAYGRFRMDRPRTCVMFATTNDQTYLKSQTGDRRFWPVVTRHIDLAKLAADRDQLWAEAAWYEARGVSLTLPAELWGAAALIQAERKDIDPWEDILNLISTKETYDGVDASGKHVREYRIGTKALLSTWLALPVEKQTDTVFKRACHTMRRLGWRGPMQFRIDGERHRGFAKTVEDENSE